MSTATTHIKTDKQLIPALRFKEFDGEFELSKLGDELNLFNGCAFSSKDSTEKGVRWVKIADVGINEMKLDAPSFLPSEFKEKHSKFLLNKGDYVVALTRPILGGKLKIARINNDFDGSLLNQRVGKLESKNDLEYMYCMLQQKSLISRIENRIAGTDPPNLSPNEIATLKTYIPSLPEQQKIASFLSAVDEKIQQLTRKKNLLEQYKKGVMQQLFSYEKRLHNGELRKGKLGDFGFFYYGKGAPKTSIVEGAPTPCVRYGELYSTFKEEIKEIKSYTIVDPKDLKLSKGGEVLVPRVGEKPLEFANCSYLPFANVAIGEMISVYNTNEDGLFMTYYINARLQKQLARMVEGGNVSNLYFRYVEKIEIEIPSVEEQEKIIGFLSSIDTKIEAIGKQITQTQTFKKGLLQQMFVAA